MTRSARRSRYISLANDWVLTIMLCLYLLAARSGRTEYDHHRAKHAVGELSVMEKIEGTAYLRI